MSKYLKLFFFALAICINAAWADDVEDSNAAYFRGDYATAAQKLKNAAARNDVGAQSKLGFLYSQGLGVVKDDTEAVRWYKLAAAQGNASAQSNLGLKYANGQGVLQDYAEAVRWFKLAAAKGDERAQYNLGVMYSYGQGVLQDHVRAHMWFNIAAVKGDKDSVKNRDISASKMTAQQIAEAQKLAKECLAKNFKNCD